MRAEMREERRKKPKSLQWYATIVFFPPIPRPWDIALVVVEEVAHVAIHQIRIQLMMLVGTAWKTRIGVLTRHMEDENADLFLRCPGTDRVDEMLCGSVVVAPEYP